MFWVGWLWFFLEKVYTSASLLSLPAKGQVEVCVHKWMPFWLFMCVCHDLFVTQRAVGPRAKVGRIPTSARRPVAHREVCVPNWYFRASSCTILILRSVVSVPYWYWLLFIERCSLLAPVWCLYIEFISLRRVYNMDIFPGVDCTSNYNHRVVHSEHDRGLHCCRVIICILELILCNLFLLFWFSFGYPCSSWHRQTTHPRQMIIGGVVSLVRPL